MGKLNFVEWIKKNKYDVVCLQETKISKISDLAQELQEPGDGYDVAWNVCQEKKGYSGVAVYSKLAPQNFKTDFGPNSLLSQEGRVIEVDYNDFVLLNVYFPNGKARPERLLYKLKFYAEFLVYVKKLLKSGRQVIFTGDVNTAHKEIDLARPKENAKVSGFLPEERAWIDGVMNAGFVDTFRLFHPGPGHYSWWDQLSGARERNVGWRIDYFFVSSGLVPRVKEAFILPEVMGSDHAPVGLVLK